MGTGTALALYEIVAEFRDAAAQLSTLDVDEQTIDDTLEALRFPLEQKATNVACIVRNLEATAEAIKQAENQMADRRTAIENRAKRIREYLRVNMESAGVKEIDSPWFKLSIRKNPPAVVIERETDVPKLYMRQAPPPPPAPDKREILAALKAGDVVPGCRLEAKTRLEIK